MRKILFGTLFVAMLLAGNNSIAQNPVYDVGPVWRMIYYRFNPGQEGVFCRGSRSGLPVFLCISTTEHACPTRHYNKCRL